jgi:hypothetical protein
MKPNAIDRTQKMKTERWCYFLVSMYHPPICSQLNKMQCFHAQVRRAHLGDLLIICTYAPMMEADIETYVPKLVFVDEKNRITGLKHQPA